MDKPIDKLPPGALQPMASSWCHSVGELEKVDFEWTIHEYEFRGPKKRLQSETFPFMQGPASRHVQSWYLILEDNCISICHYPCQYGPELEIRVKTAFLNAKRENFFPNQIIIPWGKGTYHANSTPREILLHKSNDLIVDGNLTIYCEVETYGHLKELSGKTPAQTEPVPSDGKAKLVEDFGDLFENMKHSDVTINVTGQQFRAHKVILATRSPVFAAMFEHPSKENMTGIVDIADIEVNVFKELLRYIYTGQVPSLRMDEVAAGLLAAADISW